MGRQARVVKQISRREKARRERKTHMDGWNSAGIVSSWIGRPSSGSRRSKQLLPDISYEGREHKGFRAFEVMANASRHAYENLQTYVYHFEEEIPKIEQWIKALTVAASPPLTLDRWGYEAFQQVEQKHANVKSGKPLRGYHHIIPCNLLWNTCWFCSENRVHSYEFISRRTIPCSVIGSSSATWVSTCESVWMHR